MPSSFMQRGRFSRSGGGSQDHIGFPSITGQGKQTLASLTARIDEGFEVFFLLDRGREGSTALAVDARTHKGLASMGEEKGGASLPRVLGKLCLGCPHVLSPRRCWLVSTAFSQSRKAAETHQRDLYQWIFTLRDSWNEETVIYTRPADIFLDNVGSLSRPGSLSWELH